MRETATGHARIEGEPATGHAQCVRVIHRRERDRTCAPKEPRWGRDRICVSCRRSKSATGYARITAHLRLLLSSSWLPRRHTELEEMEWTSMFLSGKRLER